MRKLILECLLIIVFILILYPANAQGWSRPQDCPVRAWCGCVLGYKVFGVNKRELWLARNWLKIGRPVSSPRPGVIAVYARGRHGGHVGLVSAVTGPHTIILWSGNDNGMIRERERSTRGVIGYREL